MGFGRFCHYGISLRRRGRYRVINLARRPRDRRDRVALLNTRQIREIRALAISILAYGARARARIR